VQSQLEAADGTKLHAWFIKQPNPDMVPTLIFFQVRVGCLTPPGFAILLQAQHALRTAEK
jgi:hypothetical protein